MGMTIKNLSNGRVSDSTANIYLCPAGTSAIIKEIRMRNIDTGAHTVNVFFRLADGTTRYLSAKNVSIAAGSVAGSAIFTTTLTLGAGDSIQADADTDNVVDYIISGMEIT